MGCLKRIGVFVLVFMVIGAAISGFSQLFLDNEAEQQLAAARDGKTRAKVPDLIGTPLDQVGDPLRSAGFDEWDAEDAIHDRKIVLTSNWEVVTQDPPAGRSAPFDRVIELGVRKIGEEDTTPTDPGSPASELASWWEAGESERQAIEESIAALDGINTSDVANLEISCNLLNWTAGLHRQRPAPFADLWWDYELVLARFQRFGEMCVESAYLGDSPGVVAAYEGVSLAMDDWYVIRNDIIDALNGV